MVLGGDWNCLGQAADGKNGLNICMSMLGIESRPFTCKVGGQSPNPTWPCHTLSPLAFNILLLWLCKQELEPPQQRHLWNQCACFLSCILHEHPLGLAWWRMSHVGQLRPAWTSRWPVSSAVISRTTLLTIRMYGSWVLPGNQGSGFHPKRTINSLWGSLGGPKPSRVPGTCWDGKFFSSPWHRGDLGPR